MKAALRWWGEAAAGGLVLFFLILKCFALHPHTADEGIYFYDAWRLTQGARLYRDLFFAHPPLQLVPVTLLAFFHASVPVLKIVPQLAGAAQGALAYFLGRRVFDSRGAGLIACAALLYSEDFLKSSSYFTDITLAGALLFGGLLLLLHRRPIAGGLLLGASTMTLLQVAPVAALIAGAALVRDRALGKRFLAAAAAMVAGVHLLALLIGGRAFLEQVYFYHLNKQARHDSYILANLVVENLVLFGGAAVALVLSQSGHEPRPERRRLLALCAVAIGLQLVLMGTRPVIFPFYFQPAFLPMALMVGWAVARGIERLRAPGKPRDRALGAALVVAVFAPWIFSGPITDAISPKRAEQRHTYHNTYRWHDAPLIGPLNEAIRSLFWADGERKTDTYYGSITELLWNQSRRFDSYDHLVTAVNEFPADATLFGDSLTTPLIALGARRHILADFADTNVQRFTSGTTTVEDTIATLEAKGGPTLLLSAGDGGLFGLPGFRQYRDERYMPFKVFSDGDGSTYTLSKRR